MNRGILGSLSLLFVIMAFGVGLATGATIAPSYESGCSAENSEGLTGTGKYHAYAGGENNYAEAQAQGWVLGAKGYVKIDSSSNFSGVTYAKSWFSQQFEVTGAGNAEIVFSYDGSLSVSDPGSGLSGQYSAYFYISAEDILGGSRGSAKYIDTVVASNYSDIFSLTYDFGDDDVGNLFTVTLRLEAGITGNSTKYNGDDYAELAADFYNTGQIKEYSGEIQPVSPVPVPASVWLLASGLAGFIGIRGRRRFSK